MGIGVVDKGPVRRWVDLSYFAPPAVEGAAGAAAPVACAATGADDGTGTGV